MQVRRWRSRTTALAETVVVSLREMRRASVRGLRGAFFVVCCRNGRLVWSIEPGETNKQSLNDGDEREVHCCFSTIDSRLGFIGSQQNQPAIRRSNKRTTTKTWGSEIPCNAAAQ